MKIKIHFYFITISVILLTTFIFTALFSNPDLEHEVTSPQSLFSSSEEYIKFLEKVAFKDIDFRIITIKQGDNFWKIAKDYKVNIDSLIGANPHWESLVARVNQKIVVPSEKGVLNFIQDFDELEQLTETYSAEINDIVLQDLPPLYKYYYKIINEDKPIAVFIKNTKPSTEFMTDKLAEQFKTREMFRSPLGGRLSSFFGSRKHPIFRVRRFHNGIDIATKHGTAVGASRAGRVISTGWMGGYGKAVVIMHNDGFKTLYGHLSRITVRKGQYVKSGNLIGRVGSTGWSTGPHLHFTLWKEGRLINPLKVLW